MAAESAVQLAGCLRPFWYPRGLHAPEEGSRERRAREPSRNEECQCLRPGLPGRGWRRGAVRASGGKQGLKVGRTPRSCPCPMVLKDGGVGRREVENLGLGVGDRCWGDPPTPASADNGLSFPVKTWTWSGEVRNYPPGCSQMESRETGPWETPSVKALSLLLVLKGKKVVD